MKNLSDYEIQEICLGCGKKMFEIGAMAPRLNLLICNFCLIKLGPLEDHYFQIITILSDEVIKIRKQVKKLTPKRVKVRRHDQTTLDIGIT